MPTYVYRCESCEHQFEVFASMSDPDPTECEQCGEGPLVKVLFPVAVHYKGSGFYSTDYKGKKSGAGSGGASGDSAASGSSSDAAAGDSGASSSGDSGTGSSTSGGSSGAGGSGSAGSGTSSSSGSNAGNSGSSSGS